jgi:septal ring factor EnvC (AmiA/AmiB activator)
MGLFTNNFERSIYNQLFTIIQNLDNMSDDIEQIKADNAATKQALANITSDIAALDKKIADATTLQDLADLKADSSELRATAETLAALTPDEPAQPGG